MAWPLSALMQPGREVERFRSSHVYVGSRQIAGSEALGQENYLDCRAKAFPELGMSMDKLRARPYSGNSNPDDDNHSSKYAAASASLALRNITSLRRPGGSSLAALRASLAASNSRTLSGCSCLRRLRLLMRLPLMRARYQPREGPHWQASMPRIEKSSSLRHWLGRHEKACFGWGSTARNRGWSLSWTSMLA